MRRGLQVLAVVALAAFPAAAEPQPPAGPPVAAAVLAQGSIRLDGRLDEAPWAAASPIGPLQQVEPEEGAPASEATEIRVLYDADNLYLGIRCFDRTPAGIAATKMGRDAGCNLPQTSSPTPNGASLAFTQSAQTVEARLTELASFNTPAATVETVPPTAIQLATFTPATVSTNTPTVATSSAATPTPLCDVANFISDGTVPDGTKFNPNTAFTKTWRLKNVGTCTWTTSYAAVFDSGSQMSAPAVVSLTQNVPQGGTVDISVPMTATATNGTYRGDWKLRNAWFPNAS